jgi:hypothetical protein
VAGRLDAQAILDRQSDSWPKAHMRVAQTNDAGYYRSSTTGKMMMKIKLSCAVAVLVVLSPTSFAHAQHNHIQSSASGQYDRRIHDGNQSAGATTQAIENREQQRKSKKNKKVDSSAGPITERKN